MSDTEDLERLKARRDELETALAPFAKRCAEIEAANEGCGRYDDDAQPEMGSLTMYDFRQAHQVYTRPLESGTTAAISPVGLDDNGELELRVEIDERKASIFISREFWEEVGKMFSTRKEEKK